MRTRGPLLGARGWTLAHVSLYSWASDSGLRLWSSAGSPKGVEVALGDHLPFPSSTIGSRLPKVFSGIVWENAFSSLEGYGRAPVFGGLGSPPFCIHAALNICSWWGYEGANK